MKKLCLIFSIFVMVQSVVPCCQEDNCTDEIKTDQSDHHSQNQNDCNDCSPFFTCGNCLGFDFTNVGVNLKEAVEIKSKFIVVYKTQFVDDFVANIWQPPKIS